MAYRCILNTLYDRKQDPECKVISTLTTRDALCETYVPSIIRDISDVLVQISNVHEYPESYGISQSNIDEANVAFAGLAAKIRECTGIETYDVYTYLCDRSSDTYIEPREELPRFKEIIAALNENEDDICYKIRRDIDKAVLSILHIVKDDLGDAMTTLGCDLYDFELQETDKFRWNEGEYVNFDTALVILKLGIDYGLDFDDEFAYEKTQDIVDYLMDLFHIAEFSVQLVTAVFGDNGLIDIAEMNSAADAEFLWSMLNDGVTEARLQEYVEALSGLSDYSNENERTVAAEKLAALMDTETCPKLLAHANMLMATLKSGVNVLYGVELFRDNFNISPEQIPALND